MPLAYKPDSDAAKDRLTAWWNGGDIGRPALQLTVARERPWEDIPVLPEPSGWSTHYSTSDFDYRVNLSACGCIGTDFLCEAIPNIAPDLGAGCLALYLGCRGVDGVDTVWFEPFIDDPNQAHFDLDPDNFYWQFTLRLMRAQLRLGQGKFEVAFPDIIEGLDILGAMRDNQKLLIDLIERPNWVKQSLSSITRAYFHVYDPIYEAIKDERGGSVFWAWAPGRMAKLQCDFSYMISPKMFHDFMLPVLAEMTSRLDYTIYHLDGPAAAVHVPVLLSLPLNCIQWTPGAGTDQPADPKWWPLYHRLIDGGKRIMIYDAFTVADLLAFRKEFGGEIKNFLLSFSAPDHQTARQMIEAVSF